MPFDEEMSHKKIVLNSWVNNPFRFVATNDSKKIPGLRKPQLAALYMALGHLTSSPNVPATIVMPTGTGKTDTIFALIIAGIFPTTLIIVPSDALREQTAEKLCQLKTLRSIKAIEKTTEAPIVKKINTKLTEAEITRLEDVNVVIATPQALQRFSDLELSCLAALCSHLVVDEAHHVAAKSWKRIRSAFAGKPVIQFTATPFREDQESLDGKIIYNYPLKDAQSDGYFQEIEFHPIREYQPSLADKVIAEKAIELLRKDLADQKDHLMMVRAKHKNKAEQLFEIYKQHHDLNPVLIHSDTKNKNQVLENIKNKKHKVIICVDMLGEGFDLPELKIAAIHDQHRTPAITLQFIGRMTRVDTRLGTAKFVANIANQKMGAQMAELYEQSADWSSIIRDMSHHKIKREMQREELVSKFNNSENGKKILALNPWPKISAIAYTVAAKDWFPSSVENFGSLHEQLEYCTVNDTKDLVILVTKANVPVSWAKTSEIHNVEWFLYMAYYKAEQQTLFIHSSGDEGQAAKFRDLIANNSDKISGDKTFRTLHNIEFLKLQNVGLSRMTRDVRFTMHVGRDINAVMGDLENGTSIKSNVFASGFEAGKKTTAGCSYRGKIWEMNAESVDQWVRWCDRVSLKINDHTINTKDILQNVMRSEQIRDQWPAGLFFAEWPEEILMKIESKIHLIVSSREYNLLDVWLGEPVRISETELNIFILTDLNGIPSERLSIIRLLLLSDGYKTVCPGVKISMQNSRLLSEFLDDNPIAIFKTDGSFVFGNYRYYSPTTLNVKIPRHLISAWDWGNVKIQNESMGKEKDLDTVQGFTFQEISDAYQTIFNDDGSREIADLIGINEYDNVIEVDFYHCKYCGAKEGVAKPGARVTDTYEVCGQTSRSVKWLHSGEALFSQLLFRYENSIEKGFDRILKGHIATIDLLRYKCRDKELKIGFYIVQPAISESVISDEQLTVLGTSYTYVKGIAGVDLKVIINKKGVN